MRAEIEDICEEAVRPVDPGFFKHLREEVAGGADEWYSLPLFFGSPRFTDDGHLCSPLAHAFPFLGSLNFVAQ